MSELRAFHGRQSVKDAYLSRVQWHREQDNLTQGIGWDNGRGCAIGCTLEAYDHSRYPIELGLPEWLAQLEDRIFEGLPKEDAMAWPERFLSAIPVGADVEPVRHHLAIRRIDRLIELQIKSLDSAAEEHRLRDAITQTVAALQVVRACHEAELGGDACDWSAARSAAWSAARSAESAAWSAAWSAERSAARSAAASAARSAESAAWSAEWSAESAAWRQEAEDLLELLTAVEAKP